MNTPHQGAGTCTFSNGAAYQMHIGGAQQRAGSAASTASALRGGRAG